MHFPTANPPPAAPPPPPPPPPPRQPRPHRVALDILEHRQKVFVFLYQERFITALVERPRSNRLRVCMHTARVRVGKPMHEFAHVAILFRKQLKMPMIWHERIGEQKHLHQLDGIKKQSFKNLVLAGLRENLQPPDGTVDDVIRMITNIYTRNASHGFIMTRLWAINGDCPRFPSFRI